MSPATGIVVDGLRRALCPSIDAILSSSHKAAARSRPQSRRLRSVTTRNHDNLSPTSRCQIRRTYSSAAPINTESRDDATVPTPHKPETSAALSQSSTAKLYETLRELRGQMGKGAAIRNKVQSIMQTDGQRANIFLYEALLAANWDTAGSVDELALILGAAQDSGIPLSSNLYHDALRALAIHPDYSLRAAILSDMSDNDILLSTDGKISVALGYLRDGQHEMALDYLDEMIAHVGGDAESIPPWVWDIFIYNLGTLGFVDESFRLLQKRIKSSPSATISPVLWNFVLEECSRALHYGGTEFVWNRLVELDLLNPSDGTTHNVLNTAARHKDSALATQAIQHLSAKRIKLGLQHYEPLLDCYAANGDLENALRVLCIMNDAGFQTDPASTRSLYTALKSSPELLATGPDILRSLHDTYKDIPTSAMNVLIESLPATEWAAAVDIYQQIRHLCRLGPNKRTFDLLREKATSAEEIRFVVTELYMSGLRRDWSMYDALVYAYTLDNRLDDAFRFLEKITGQEENAAEVGSSEAEGGTDDDSSSSSSSSKRHWLRQRTLFALLECCFRHADERAWWLIDEARGKGVEVGRERVLEWVELARRTEEEEKERAQAPQPETLEQAGEKIIDS
ncbi:hypothetical protein QBC37DRAFT_433169 [Rhypophila decipiens]|uniref:Pentatricopeptide repeat protein n=1 Tax=Rhypophila decipiens TaxID=261697 RepID=A0AAN6XXR2_9PEZI|nr:hypothetical protein QBC37DRAFT_433169 [Rhypophila decipiens]